jgi:hypothetical protein
MQGGAEGAEIISFDRGIGHNGAPFDFFEFFDMVVESSANTYEKLLALVLARHVGKNGEAAFPSRDRMMRQASCSVATFKRSQAALSAFFNAETRRGRATLYTPKAIVTAADVEAAIQAARKEVSDRTRALTDTKVGISQIPTSERVGISQSQKGALTDTTNGISQIPQKDPLKDPRKKKEPSLRSGPASLGQDQDDGSPVDPDKLVWGKGIEWLSGASGVSVAKLKPIVGKWLKVLTYDEMLHAMRGAAKAKTGDPIAYIGAFVASAKDAEHSVRREKGRLVVMNGFKAELEGLLAGRDLQRTLDQIAAKIPIGISGIELETKVRGMAIELVDRVADQDRRYASATAEKAGPQRKGYDRFYEGVL